MDSPGGRANNRKRDNLNTEPTISVLKYNSRWECSNTHRTGILDPKSVQYITIDSVYNSGNYSLPTDGDTIFQPPS